METVSHDILIVGGGAAGLRAAIAAAKANPQASIALISKVYPVRSHTVSAEGGLAAVLRSYDTFEQHIYDTVKGSDFLADQDAVEFFVREAPKEIIALENFGCPFSREENGEMAVRAFGGMSVKRTCFAADKTGFYMLHALFEQSLRYENIVRYDEFFVTKLFRDDSGMTGLFAIDLRRGKFVSFAGRAVILATGGAGKIYRFTTNGNIKTGDGMALALSAGASLKDMEFVQFHPTGLPRTGILITEAARGEGGYLINKHGERFMKKYLPSKMELGPRDMISRAIMEEIRQGNGIDGPYGSFIHLDLRHLGEKLINEKLPLVREMAQEYEGIDPVKEPIPVRPVSHYFMGGIHTNLSTATDIPGLFAAGECACVSINGANRLGSNSLTECLVFGRRAGEQTAEYASGKITENSSSMMEEEEHRLKKLLESEGKERISHLREELQNTMEDGAGIFREEQGLQRAREKISHLKERLANVSLDDHDMLFNTEFISLLELNFMLEVASTVLLAASERKESRGSHYRTDFPHRDDEHFLRHSLVKKIDNALKLEKIPVTITTYQPEERIY